MKKRRVPDPGHRLPENADPRPRQNAQRLLHELEVHQIELKSQNEELLRERNSAQQYLDTVETIIVALDTEGLVTSINRKGCELFGCGEDELVGQQWFSVCLPQPEGMETVYPYFRRLMSGNLTPVEHFFENPILTRSGERRLIAWHNALLRDEQGSITGSLGSGQDITERMRAEESLRESKERLALILDSAAEGIYGLDAQGNCTFCNPAALRLLGYREERELLGKSMHELTHHTKADGTPHPRGQCLVARTFKKGETVHSEQECLWRSDGTSFLAEYWAHPMHRAGERVGAVVTFIDRTEHAALERQLRQAQKLEAVGQLAAGVAHDFNNILSSIIGHGHLTLLKMAKDDPPRLNVESMIAAACQASRLVQSLLTVGRQQLTSQKPVDLNAVAAGAIQRLARSVGQGVELKPAIGGEPLPVLADTGQIELVLQNLAANAVEAMPRGGVLHIATERFVMDEGFIAAHGFGRPGPCALLSVSDTGAGMDERTQKRIFEPFFTPKEFGRNTGLGLAIAYGIVKQHDGFIVVSSRPGTGTTFSVYLPLHNPGRDTAERTP